LFADFIKSEPVDGRNHSINLEGEQQRVPPHNISSVLDSASSRPSESVEADTSREKNPLETDTQPEVIESLEQLEEGIASSLFTMSAFSHTELLALVMDKPTREARIKEVSELLRYLVVLGQCQIQSNDREEFLRTLDFICDPESGLPRPIKFKDAVGRNFGFPWHLCKSWKVSRQLFVHK
jgi:hypothetical protein